MSHTELALCLGQCTTNFLKEKQLNKTQSALLQGQHPHFLCCGQGGSDGAAISCSQWLSVADGDGESFPSSVSTTAAVLGAQTGASRGIAAAGGCVPRMMQESSCS